jgi:hypothetical protein
MAFLRFTRDKRGYEHFYLVEPTVTRRGRTEPRVLYWFRTPPNVRVGREPFDAAIRRALEKENPDVRFDWTKILETPIPSVDVEKWRERRRIEKAEKAARRAASRDEPDEELASTDAGSEAAEPPDEDGSVPEAQVHSAESSDASLDESIGAPPTADAQPSQDRRERRRRRRRRGRGQRPGSPGEPPAEIGTRISTAQPDDSRRDEAEPQRVESEGPRSDERDTESNGE